MEIDGRKVTVCRAQKKAERASKAHGRLKPWRISEASMRASRATEKKTFGVRRGDEKKDGKKNTDKIYGVSIDHNAYVGRRVQCPKGSRGKQKDKGILQKRLKEWKF